MRSLRLLLIVLFSVLAFGQAAPDAQKIWQDMVSWLKAQRSLADISADKYRARLIQNGTSAARADERLAAALKLFSECRDQLEPTFADKIYMNPGQARFTYGPIAFLVQQRSA